MRISDWSSDVCSSDLIAVERLQQHEMLLHAGAYASRAKLIEKIEEHRLSYRAMGPTWNHETDFVQPPRGVRNASRSNIITSCSFLRSAPCNGGIRSEEHPSELQSLMRISYAVFCFKK